MTKTRRLLMELGLDDTLVGFRIIEEAIGMVVEDPALEKAMTDGLYMKASKRVGASPDAAPRNLRYSMQKLALRSDLMRRIERVEKKWEAYGLGDAIVTPSGSISPKKLILKVAHLLGSDYDKEV